MNLKEAFRYQKYFDSLLEKGEDILRNDAYTTRTFETLLRSKVKDGEVNETTDVSVPNPYTERLELLIRLMEAVLEEKERLYEAITKAKKSLSFDLDGAVAMNIRRQSLRSVLTHMGEVESRERLVRGGGRGYVFNAEGNQSEYKCDLKSVTTIAFDRNAVRGKARRLSELSDKTSSSIDVALVTTTVDYTSPFSVNDTFEEVLEAYAAR